MSSATCDAKIITYQSKLELNIYNTIVYARKTCRHNEYVMLPLQSCRTKTLWFYIEKGDFEYYSMRNMSKNPATLIHKKKEHEPCSIKSMKTVCKWTIK